MAFKWLILPNCSAIHGRPFVPWNSVSCPGGGSCPSMSGYCPHGVSSLFYHRRLESGDLNVGAVIAVRCLASAISGLVRGKRGWLPLVAIETLTVREASSGRPHTNVGIGIHRSKCLHIRSCRGDLAHPGRCCGPRHPRPLPFLRLFPALW